MPIRSSSTRVATRVSTREKRAPQPYEPSLSTGISRKPAPILIPAGNGVKLSNLSVKSAIEALNNNESPLLVQLHYILFQRKSKSLDFLRNVLEWCGFENEDDETPEELQERIQDYLLDSSASTLRSLSSLFGLETAKLKGDIAKNLAAFLICPDEALIVNKAAQSSRPTYSRDSKKKGSVRLAKCVRADTTPMAKRSRK
ncbi:hypothetical protein GEMRC1_001562 [Eukaryota sp. GEM-RC1]